MLHCLYCIKGIDKLVRKFKICSIYTLNFGGVNPVGVFLFRMTVSRWRSIPFRDHNSRNLSCVAEREFALMPFPFHPHIPLLSFLSRNKPYLHP